MRMRVWHVQVLSGLMEDETLRRLLAMGGFSLQVRDCPLMTF